MTSPRSFATTLPQLIDQARDAGLDEEQCARLHRAGQLALRVFDGSYMNDESLATHHFRCASIALWQRWPLHVVLAALLHNAHAMHLGTPRRRQPRRRHRDQLRAELGAEAEALVWSYLHFPYRPDDVERYVGQVADGGGPERELLWIRVANELAHFADGAIRFGTGQRPGENARLSVELVRTLGLDELAVTLEEWIEFSPAHSQPPDRELQPLEFELPARHWWAAGPLERIAVRVVRTLRGKR